MKSPRAAKQWNTGGGHFDLVLAVRPVLATSRSLDLAARPVVDERARGIVGRREDQDSTEQRQDQGGGADHDGAEHRKHRCLHSGPRAGRRHPCPGAGLRQGAWRGLRVLG